jgi:hypothetical protein
MRGKERPKQAKQRRHDPRTRHSATTTQRRAAFGRMQQPYPSPSLHSPARAPPALDNCCPRLLACTLIISHFRPRCSPGPWALRPSWTKAPTSQQVIPATPPIAICRQTVHCSRPSDAPRLRLRVEDIVWPCAHRRLPARSKTWDKHPGGLPILAFTIVIRVSPSHSPRPPLFPHSHQASATPLSLSRDSRQLSPRFDALCNTSLTHHFHNRRITYHHNTAHTTTWRDAAQ